MQNLTNFTDQELVTAYANGDNAAFDVLLRRHQGVVFPYIFNLVKDEDLANDIFQETFIKAITQIRQGRYDETGKFAQWACRVAHNLTIDHFRRKKTEKAISNDQSETDMLNNQSLCEENIEDQIIQNQIITDLKKMIHLLPESQREVVKMRFYQDLSFKEIADKTGVSINTALGRMRYALLNMRRLAVESEALVG